MKLLYLDCQMGAAGDMLTAALLELLPNPEAFLETLNKIGIPHVEFKRIPAQKCGITGTQMQVLVHGQEEGAHEECGHSHEHRKHSGCGHHHTSLSDIENIISALQIPSAAKKDVLSVYSLIAEAESHAHGVPVSEIHFHEVGTYDAIADITAVCLLIHQLQPDKIIASPIHVGSGHVHCAHGILPVPAPATAYLLRGCPIYGGAVKGELCTPTGAALLKYFADEFGDMPMMNLTTIGYGMGKKDFSQANCVRAMLGEIDSDDTSCDIQDFIWELSCNVDDMTAEQIGYALSLFLEEGAVEAFTIPIGIKKNRPGTLICVLCKEEKKEHLISVMFQHTSTCGIRHLPMNRSVLNREIVPVNTPYGVVSRKNYSGYGVTRAKYEY